MPMILVAHRDKENGQDFKGRSASTGSSAPGLRHRAADADARERSRTCSHSHYPVSERTCWVKMWSIEYEYGNGKALDRAQQCSTGRSKHS